jgi:hypothetical protein
MKIHPDVYGLRIPHYVYYILEDKYVGRTYDTEIRKQQHIKTGVISNKDNEMVILAKVNNEGLANMLEQLLIAEFRDDLWNCTTPINDTNYNTYKKIIKKLNTINYNDIVSLIKQWIF